MNASVCAGMSWQSMWRSAWAGTGHAAAGYRVWDGHVSVCEVGHHVLASGVPHSVVRAVVKHVST